MKPLFYLAAFALLSHPLSAQNIVRDPGFEEGDTGWNLPYVPNDSQDKGCSFSISAEEPHSGKSCGMLESTDNGRIAISPKGMPMAVEAGQKYRLVAWVRAGKDFEAQSGQPGLLIRVDMLQSRDALEIVTIDWQGHAKAMQPSESLTGFATEPVPKTWTKVESTFTVPENTETMRAGLFLWKATGQLFVDDFVIEPVR